MNKIIITGSMLFFSLQLAAQNVGIGTANPQAKFHTVGSVRMDTLLGAGKRPVYADAAGNLSADAADVANVNSAAGAVSYPCSAGGVTRSIIVAGQPVSVSSAITRVRINIVHPYDADLYGYLTAPNGAVLNLFYANGATGDNFTNTVFFDGAPAALPFTATGAPFTGNYKPTANNTPVCSVTPTVSTFAAIGGGTINPNGVWTLKVFDNANGDDGILLDWGISFNNVTPSSPPYLQNNYSVRAVNGVLANGSIYDNGTGLIGLGTTTPGQRLEVSGITKTDNLILDNGGTAGDFLLQTGPGSIVSAQKGTGGLGLNYIIALQGIFPPQGGGSASYTQQFIGEVRLFAGNFAPNSWAFCQGQLLPISSNTALFSILGTTYGGNGTTTFALPDLRGSVPVHPGTAPNTANWSLGEKN